MRRDRTLFWLFIVLQAAGCQVLLWFGLPLYHRLLAGGSQGATDMQLAMGVLALVIMQSGHWLSLRLKPKLQFRRNVILGHLLFSLGEISLFFISALAVLVFFDRFDELNLNVWKILLIVAILFSVCSYKYQVGALGAELIEGDSGDRESTRERRRAA